MSSRPMTALEWGLLLALSLLWGASFPWLRIGAAELPAFTLVWLRVGGGALCLIVFLAARRTPLPRQPAVWGAFAGMGLLNNVIPFSLFSWAVQTIPGGLAAVLNAATPLFTVLVAHWLTADERLTWGRVAGVLVGMVGVALVLGPEALWPAGAGADWLLPQLACLLAALSYAFSGVWGRRFRRLGVPPEQAAAGQLTCSTVMLAPLALTLDQPWTLLPLEPATVWAVVGLAVLGTAVAYLLFFRILGSAGATNIMLVTLLVPPSAILIGAVFLGETLEPLDLAGLAVIALGLIVIDGRLPRAAGLRLGLVRV